MDNCAPALHFSLILSNRNDAMFISIEKLVDEIRTDRPDPAAANALQEGLGGQFGEMRTMMQYQFQNFNF